MPTTQDLLLGTGLPLAVSFVLLLLTGGSREEGAEARLTPWMRTLALTAGFLAGFLALFGWPAWPPVEGWQWLPLLGFALLLSAFLESTVLARELHWLPRLLVALAVVRLVLAPWLEYEAQGEEILWWPVGIAVAWVFAVTAVDALAARRPGAAWPLVLTLTTAATAIALLDAGSARLAQAEGALAAACGGAVLVAGLRRGFHLGRGPAAAALAVHAGILLNAHFFAELPLAAAAVLLGAPLAGVLGEAPVFRSRPAWQGIGFRLVAVALALAAALYMIRSGQPAAAPPGY